MVGAYHGHDIDLNGVRQRFAISSSGTTLRGLIDLSRQLGLAARPLRIDLEGLLNLPLPAILHWNLNHFVVLKAINKGRLILHDPSNGVVSMTLKSASPHFTGVVLEITPTDDFAPLSARLPVGLGSLWRRLRGGASSAAFLLTVSLAVQATSFLAPLQLQLIVDEVIVRNNADLLVVIASAFFLLMIAQVALSAARDWSLQILGGQLVMQMVGNLFRHLVRLPTSYFEKRHIGDIVSRLGAVRFVQDTLTQGAVTVAIDGLMAIAAGCVLFLYAPKLALAVFAGLAAIVLLNLAFYPRLKALTENGLALSAQEQSYLMETVRGITTVKLLGGEAQREGAWRNLFVNTLNANIRLQRLAIWQSSLQNLVLGTQIAIVVYIATRDVLAANGFSIGMLTAFLAFRQMFMDRTLSLVAKAQQFQVMGVYLDRLGDIVTQEPETVVSEPVSGRTPGEISIRGLGFRYGATDAWVFQRLDLDVRDGEFLAITGASGIGKSTLLKLMLGLQAPVEGDIFISGVRASAQRWRGWRERTGVVTQDDRLMSGSLADNIAFFDPDMRMDKVVEAAKAAEIHDDIERMPMNYRTLVGDMGSSLSGGQRQRVLLARALYRDPAILILDEGTANLDPEVEEAIAVRIGAMRATRIVVAHRPALIERADRVLKLVDGELRVIRDRRSPAELDDRDPFNLEFNKAAT
ncbi:ATP-binding cassette subfamily B protein RaxB [Caulobacter sp. 1776]